MNKTILAALVGLVLTAAATHAQSTAFTYSGQLRDNGLKHDGPIDLQFGVYDTATDGVRQGSLLALDDVPVRDGLFQVTLDFGLGVFTGAPRWLEIGVRPTNSAGAYTILSPRTEYTSTPYAIKASGSDAADVALMALAVAPGTITATMLGNGAVGSSQLANGAVGAAQIGMGAVTADKLKTIPVPVSYVIFTNPTPADGDFFGHVVAAVGTDKVLIGAAYDDSGAQDAGAAYLFSTNGTLLITFNNPTPAEGALFGIAVAAVGADKVIIGARGVSFNGYSGAGAAYLFSTNGTLLTTFIQPTPGTGNLFGHAVAAVGPDKVLIAAPAAESYGKTDAGEAYLFSTTGTLLATFRSPYPDPHDHFGISVTAVGSDRVLIGAYHDDANPNQLDAGAAYLFSINGTLQVIFREPTPAVANHFGFSVAALGSDRMLISADLNDTGAFNAGVAHLFTTNGTSYGEFVTTFTNPTPADNDVFGFVVAALGTDKVLIGAFLDNTAAEDAGAVYLFDTTGTLLTTFLDPAHTIGDRFGRSVAGVGTDKVLIGAQGNDTGANDAGVAYLFALVAVVPGVFADGVVPGAIGTTSLGERVVTSDKIADGGVDVSNLSSNVLSNTFWNLSGNAGTTATNFLGTTDNQPFELMANGLRGLRLDPTGNDASHANFINVIGGSPLNFVAPGVRGATISGGGGTLFGSSYSNSVTADNGAVSGGLGNTSSGSGATVGGGINNTSSGNNTTVGGGIDNTGSVVYATVSGGRFNRGSGFAATVGGGYGNTSSDDHATVGGGSDNTSSNNYATVPGGSFNVAGGRYSLAAGRQARALHDGTFVWNDSTGPGFSSSGLNQFLIRASGGVGIDRTNPVSALDVNGIVTANGFQGDGSGLTNLSLANAGNVARLNVGQTFIGANSFVGPVTATNTGNTFAGTFLGDGSTLSNIWKLGGNAGSYGKFLGTTDELPLEFRVYNQLVLHLESSSLVVDGSANLIGGSPGNTIATGIAGVTISGGGSSEQPNRAEANWATISGGQANQIQSNAWGSAIGGGTFNTIQTNASGSTISGGVGNSIEGTSGTGGYGATIAGGQFNAILSVSPSATIGGGKNNLIETQAENSTIGGGTSNEVQFAADAAFIGGGIRNRILRSADWGTIGDGFNNTIGTNSHASTIGGGYGNAINPYTLWATIPGGADNVAAGQYSFAAGQKARAMHAGAFVWADSQFADFGSSGVNQFLIRASGGVGIGKTNPVSTLDVNGMVTANGFQGDGSGLTNLTLANAANVALLNVNQTFSGVNSFNPGSGAPFAVGNATKVTSLNADLLDGLDSGAFALSAHTHAATDITSGTLNDARLSTNVALLGGSQTFSGAKAMTNAGNTFAGTFTGTFTGNGAGLTNLSMGSPGTNVAVLNSNQTFTASNVFSGVVTMTNLTNRLAGILSGNGTGIASLSATSLVTGTVSDARLSNNVARLELNQTFTGTQNFNPASGTPFAVGSASKVTNLNADLVDGLDSSAFASSSHTHAATDITSGTLNDGRLSANVALLGGSQTYSGAKAMTNAANTFAGVFTGNFTGNGAGLTNLNVGNLGTNVPLLNSNQTFSASNVFTGVVTMTNGSNNVTGNFTGNGGGLTNLNIGGLSGGVNTNAVNFPNAANFFSGTFTGNGGGLTNLNASQLIIGMVPDARLSNNVARTNQVWLLGGNGGTTAGTQFLGTRDSQPLEVKVNNTRAQKFEATTGTPNLIGGSSNNFVAPGIVGATIGGGGAAGFSNRVTATYGTVAGGLGNSVLGNDSFIGGGIGNTVQTNADRAVITGGRDNSIGTNADNSVILGGADNAVGLDAWYALAAGRQAKANHFGTFVWADAIGADFSSTANNQFLIRASGGVGIGVNNPSAALDVAGTVKATVFSGNGSGVTNINATLLEGLGASNFWKLGGNSGTTPGTHLLGTTDDRALEFKVNGTRALRLEPNALGAPNIIAGAFNNVVVPGTLGAVISGGAEHTVSGNNSSIGGGYHNTATNLQSVVAGGAFNVAGGSGSSVGGGSDNVVRGAYSTIAGGNFNTVKIGVDYATVSGGENNAVLGNHSAVGGGEHNHVAGSYSAIGGGYFNQVGILAVGSFVGGGYFNTNAGSDSAIVGGQANQIQSFTANAAIGGGAVNLIDSYSTAATISGGNNNRVGPDALAATIAGGQGNVAEAGHASIGGGQANTNFAAHHGTIGGGTENFLDAAFYATVAGGRLNHIAYKSDDAAIGGGRQNVIFDQAAEATIAGGSFNTIELSAYGGAIGGGNSNTNSGPYGVVPGGYQNVAGTLSFAAGYRAKATHTGAFVWADYTDSDFATTRTNQFLIRASGGVGINTATTVDGSLTVNTNVYVNDHPIYLRGASGTDHNHGLAYCGNGVNNFAANVQPDGPVLWGYGGGALGVKNGSGPYAVLNWNAIGASIGRSPSGNNLEIEGNASKTTAGGWLANSDARIKTGVQTVTNALATLEQVRLVQFHYTDEYRAAHPSVGDRAHLNVIAQEFQKVFPEHVKRSGEKLPNGDDILQVDTYPLTIYSAAAVQELSAKLKAKDAEIQELKQRMESMEKLLGRLATVQGGAAR